MVSRTSIDEANRHLMAMHERVTYLEKVVQEQNQALLDKDSHLQHRMSELERLKAKEVQEIKGQVQDLETRISQKDSVIQKLQEQITAMQKIYTYLPHLKHLVETLEETKLSLSDNLPNEGGDHMVNGVFPIDNNVRREPMNVSSLAKHYVTNHRSRNFSISEDDSDLETDNMTSTMTTTRSSIQEESQQTESKEKEYYL